MQRRHGITGRPAPSFTPTEWVHIPRFADVSHAERPEGRVTWLMFFQTASPGCLRFGLPTLRTIQSQFEHDDRVCLVAIQTVFQHAAINTPDMAFRTVQQYGLHIPVGHDVGPDGGASPLLGHYRAGGTPWNVVIDPDGDVLYDGFDVSAQGAVQLIDRILSFHDHDAIEATDG